ncbi:MAG: D-glycerate dehydrogenase [Planctomycetes bacterium]|nr:D-glycerate dehydrogenase [Planctomycetota bacterium]
MPTEPIVAVCRNMPGVIALPGANIRQAPGERALPRDQLKALVQGASILITWVSEKIDREILDAAGPSLRAVCNFAVGTDNIDLSLCRERGIVVTNTPHAVTEGTANLAWALILACARRLVEADRYARSDTYPANGPFGPSDFMGMDITGKTLCIVGAGRIGYATALRGIGFGMRTTYVARTQHIDFELAPLSARRLSLDEGLATADIISVHTPLTPQTRGMIGSRELSLLKPTAIFINTARGPIVQEEALATALQQRKIWSAGLDVFEKEPVVHPLLRTLDNCVLAPHIGSAEFKYRALMAQMVCENAAAVLAGTEPPNRVV